ncbi:MAG TPA: hypothetical protein VKD70_13510 [Candidatus Acidoferrum sp.]|nr:hypothetical protein [Candidatus Acidoferrum sp.]
MPENGDTGTIEDAGPKPQRATLHLGTMQIAKRRTPALQVR